MSLIDKYLIITAKKGRERTEEKEKRIGRGG